MSKKHTGLLEKGKMSVAAHYSGLCCPFDVDPYRWGNKKRGAVRRKKKSLRDHRQGLDFRGKFNFPAMDKTKGE